jgi:P4 family phage/plasmid primase-like protien
MTSSKKSFDEYMKVHTAQKGSAFTHTRIPDKTLNIFGGLYNIASNEWNDFIKRYYTHVFVNGNMEYLTEKQLIENGPILIDIDLRYDKSITQKQHTEEHIRDMVMLYAEKISELVQIKDNSNVDVFVMEKNNVNILEDKTKDGIHVIICIKMHKALQVLLRNKVIDELRQIWDDLPVTNTWDNILDEGVTKGFVNWQLYGSRKPAHLAYLIKYHYVLNYSVQNYGWSIQLKDLSSFSTEHNMEKLSAQYTDHIEFDIIERVKEEFEKAKTTLNKNKQPGNNTNKSKPSATSPPGSSSGKFKMGRKNDFQDINSELILDEYLTELFQDNTNTSYKLKEIHNYTMALPASYYGSGSYNNWIRVGWALSNTNHSLFLTWIKFSCQENCRDTLRAAASGKFDWSCISDLYEMWSKFTENNTDGLTARSIMYWCKRDALDKYNDIKKNTIDHFIEESIKTSTEFDIACVLYNLYKDDFICQSIKHNSWYEYNNKHRWVVNDEGTSLRIRISKDMHQLYMDKTAEIMIEMAQHDSTSEAYEKLKKKGTRLSEISNNLKRTGWKNNIMKEAKELFYDNKFIEKLDQNPYLLCFNNYVVDFRNKTYRIGQPDDYISKCTNIDYIPPQEGNNIDTIKEINEFMEQLFPNEELRTYMWEHAASCLIGTNSNQTFNIYKGSGRNGKSKFVELMGHALGDYKGTVPITLITQKRNSIGSTSSEVAQLNAIRYAVMQEPSKGDKINEGIMKEITGGDPIQARALFKDTITFTPQFKLVVCTNTDFEDMANDDGTWRRIRMIDFMSKMLENPYEDPKFPKNDFPYQFPIDKNLDNKFKTWAPIFMSMLVEKAYVLQGLVNDCKTVMASSDKYRERQDYFTSFAKEKIQSKTGEKIKKTELLETFKRWYSANFGNKGVPAGREVYEFMDKRFGEFKGCWRNVCIIYDADDNDPLDEC